MFASAGVGEAYLPEIGLEVVVANELLERRAALHSVLYPKCQTVCGDITRSEVFAEIIDKAKGVDFLLASPPCQGMSVAGKNRHQDTMVQDKRNFLINYVFEAIDILRPRYVMIENVPQLLKIMLPHNGELRTVVEILRMRFGSYEIEERIVDAADYGVPQTRKRAIVKMFPKGSKWAWPKPVERKTTVREAIGHLPSLEAGQRSDIKWHYARPHTAANILCMRHTPTGQSAFSNPVHYPKKSDGTRIKGYQSSYRRIKWDEPAPTITIRNDCIASQRNVHPGRLLPDGTYSDARVLTPLELMLLDSLPADWHIPDDTPELLVRQIIGESIPPLMVKKIIQEIPELQ